MLRFDCSRIGVRVSRKLGLVTLCLILSACDGPMGFMAGGELRGTVAEPPETWQLASDGGFAELETRPNDPYSINLAYVQLNGELYIYAGDTRTNWVQHIEQDSRVRLKVGEMIYPVQAERVNDRAELVAFAAEWASRSMFQRDPMQFEEVWLYRLKAR